MKINDKYEIKETLYGYEMIRQTVVIDAKTKQPKHGKDRTYYGTMEQALIGFVNHSIGDPETLDDLEMKVVSIRDLIASLKSDIIAERGVIRSARP